MNEAIKQSSMKTTGIIAEYNPFHNGHLYQMKKARALSGADYLIVVMSPDFVQRGTPALLDKWVRARMALMAGADLVIELPVRFAASSAEFFAGGSISLLSSLGVVQSISFGCESAHITPLADFAHFLSQEESPCFKSLIRSFLKEGASFAKARFLAWQKLSGRQDPDGLLHAPNNILAIEYLKAIYQQNIPMEVIPIHREGAGYHDTNLESIHASDPGKSSLSDSESARSSDPESPHASASGIRLALSRGQDVRAFMPSFAHQLLSEEYARGRFLTSQSLDLPLHLKLHEKRSSLTQYLDVSKDLANRIDHLLPEYTGFEQFTDLLKTKQIARTRIQRSLLHILLELEKSDAPMQVSYARILGFRKTAAGLLHSIKEHASIPLITRLPPEGQESPMLREDLNAAHLWEILAAANAHSMVQNERRRRIIMI